MPRLHPREIAVQAAAADLGLVLSEWRLAHEDLTDLEALSIMNDVFSASIGSVVKFMLRVERHGDANRPGGMINC